MLTHCGGQTYIVVVAVAVVVDGIGVVVDGVVVAIVFVVVVVKSGCNLT